MTTANSSKIKKDTTASIVVFYTILASFPFFVLVKTITYGGVPLRFHFNHGYSTGADQLAQQSYLLTSTSAWFIPAIASQIIPILLAAGYLFISLTNPDSLRVPRFQKIHMSILMLAFILPIISYGGISWLRA